MHNLNDNGALLIASEKNHYDDIQPILEEGCIVLLKYDDDSELWTQFIGYEECIHNKPGLQLDDECIEQCFGMINLKDIPIDCYVCNGQESLIWDINFIFPEFIKASEMKV